MQIVYKINNNFNWDHPVSAKYSEKVKKYQLANVRKVLYPPLSAGIRIWPNRLPSLRTPFMEGPLPERKYSRVWLSDENQGAMLNRSIERLLPSTIRCCFTGGECLPIYTISTSSP